MLSFKSDSVEKTLELGQKLAQEIYTGMNIFLFGEMGAGKTKFIKGFLKERKIKEESISSPTYTFAHYYETEKEKLVHYDLYRTEEDIENIGIEDDFFADDTTVIIEWSEKLQTLPIPRIEVHIKKIDINKREINFDFIGYTLEEKKLKNLITRYKIPKHIQKHINAVTHVALTLTEHLINKGYILNKELIRQASLLHDLVRYIDFKDGLTREKFPYKVDDDTWNFWLKTRKIHEGRHHGDVANEILFKRGYPYIGKVILAHKTRRILEGFENTSEKIIHYADNRCKHDKVVSLKERFDDFKDRYYKYYPDSLHWEELEKRNIKLEKELKAKNIQF